MARDDFDDDGYVSITKAEYDRLVERDDFLTALQGAGVDNWSGYDYAIQIKNGEEEW
jgi:hypothetical protein